MAEAEIVDERGRERAHVARLVAGLRAAEPEAGVEVLPALRTAGTSVLDIAIGRRRGPRGRTDGAGARRRGARDSLTSTLAELRCQRGSSGSPADRSSESCAGSSDANRCLSRRRRRSRRCPKTPCPKTHRRSGRADCCAATGGRGCGKRSPNWRWKCSCCTVCMGSRCRKSGTWWGDRNEPSIHCYIGRGQKARERLGEDE